jgi:hypothetical protein
VTDIPAPRATEQWMEFVLLFAQARMDASVEAALAYLEGGGHCVWADDCELPPEVADGLEILRRRHFPQTEPRRD